RGPCTWAIGGGQSEPCARGAAAAARLGFRGPARARKMPARTGGRPLGTRGHGAPPPDASGTMRRGGPAGPFTDEAGSMTTRPSAAPPHAEFFPPPRSPRAPARWVATVRSDFRELARFWPVVQNMVVQDLRVRYQRSMLGFLWTLLNPILMMATLTVVF